MNTVQVDALESALVAASVGSDGLCRMGRRIPIFKLQLDILIKIREMGRAESWLVRHFGFVANGFVCYRPVFASYK